MGVDENVLIVEDNRDIARGLGLRIRKRGGTSTWKANGTDAWEEIVRQTPSLIILDLGLPDMDGLSLLDRIRSEIKEPVPVIILTAQGTLAARQSAVERGANFFLEKPYEPDDLDQAIQSCRGL